MATGGHADVTERVRALGPGCVENLRYQLLALTGPDAGDFLHRLCSQDVKGMAPGTGKPATFLNSKGKLIAPCHVMRVDDGYRIEAETHLIDPLAQMLDRFHFAEKLQIETPAGLQCGALLGGTEVFDLAGLEAGTCKELPGTGIAYAAERHGICRVHCHAPAAFFAAPPWPYGDAAELSEEIAEAFRIAARLPRMGVDVDENTLALEAALDDHVSLSKGCYTGQEIVARIHTYGHVNRRLCLLVVEQVAELPAGAQLLAAEGDDGPVGRLSSATRLPTGSWIGLGTVKREHAETGTRLRVQGIDGARTIVC